MHRIVSLLLVASLLAGCTVGGALVGGISAARNPDPVQQQRGKRSGGERILIGAGIGLLVDLCVVGIVVSGAGGSTSLVSREAPER